MEKNWYNLSTEEVTKELDTNINDGLSTEKVQKAREKYGWNELQAQKKEKFICKIFRAI